ncbi:glycosyltransferase BC10-like [Impatiens glandulifera]|uniref:glycosyltransferase BC10-like n=1 Tax=Impatiens glandulifera TaxID=253017 RepID=UPI001FB198EB|nr:glycosyltransferase BC10-like [Impatiens glandulifera]
MSRKRPLPSTSARRRPLVILVKLAVSIFIIFGLISRSGHYTESVTEASTQNRKFLNDFERNSKIAFLFLVRENIPLDFVWHVFFKNGDQLDFSIYIHSKPGFEFNKRTTRSSFFYGRQIRHSIKVNWGEPTMIQAERLLLEEALNDPTNQRFILLSDSCVPLYNFTHIYNYLMSSPKSFVDSFVVAEKEDRYNVKMLPTIPLNKWRKGSQWISLIRRHAELVMDDAVVYRAFKRFCKPLQPPLKNSSTHLHIESDSNNCIPDEHFVQTFLAMSELEGELERRSVTYSLWNQSGGEFDTKSWHPTTFDSDNTSPQQIKEIKSISNIYFKSEDRREICRINSTFVPCFLFARKFNPDAGVLLLKQGMIGPYDPSI